MNDLADTISFHRKKATLSRVQLSQMSGVGKTTIYDLEHGKQSVKWENIKKVCAALNISITFSSPLIQTLNNEN
jgi:HTH-type transcriptional regulator/antitoxin HipB